MLKNIKVLFIGNNFQNGEEFLDLIQQYVDEVIISTPDESLSVYQHNLPELVIIGSQLSESVILHLLEVIKELNPVQSVLLSGTFSEPQALLNVITAGIDGYIVKPFDINQILESFYRVAHKIQICKKLKQGADNFQVLTDSNPSLMLILSANGVEYINQSMLDFLGYQPTEAGDYSDFCLLDYIQAIDEHDNIIQSRQMFLQYFLDNSDSQHILRFRPAAGEQDTDIARSSFMVSMNHRKDSDYYIFSLTNITRLVDENMRLEQSATTDLLTGIANRAMFEQVIERYIDRFRLQGEEFVLIFFDIDHFKSVNDDYGHDVGDVVLQEMVRTVSKHIRKRDFFARWGGEEFVVLLNNCSLDEGRLTAEHLRQQIEQTEYHTVGHITCSFAVVECQAGDSADNLLKRADIVLYRAKAAGRNCVKTYEIDDPLQHLKGSQQKNNRKHFHKTQKPLVLIADDDYMQRLPMSAALEGAGFLVEEAENGSQALELYQQSKPDLVILDVIMPEMDGFETCRRIRTSAAGKHIPILMLTALDNVDSINQAYRDGATDFLTKPVNWTLLGHKVNYLLRTANIAQTLAMREQELVNSQFEIIQRLTKAAEYKDMETGSHLIRMSHYSFELSKAMGLSEEMCSLILEASPMHDLGKIGIADAILLKPGRLTQAEYQEMQKHTIIGAELLSKNHSPVMEAAHIIALTHHERWDGSGYPNGLAGEKIPVFGRICAITDVFDALTTVRPYKQAWSVDRAFKMIEEGAGTLFDPEMVKKFIEISARIIEIKNKYDDHINTDIREQMH